MLVSFKGVPQSLEILDYARLRRREIASGLGVAKRLELTRIRDDLELIHVALVGAASGRMVRIERVGRPLVAIKEVFARFVAAADELAAQSEAIARWDRLPAQASVLRASAAKPARVERGCALETSESKCIGGSAIDRPGAVAGESDEAGGVCESGERVRTSHTELTQQSEGRAIPKGVFSGGESHESSARVA